MTYIARHPERVHTVANVAQATRVPVPTVAKLLAKLRRKGLLASTRGVKGGYALTRSPAAISVTEIITVLDGPIALTNCIGAGHGSCDIEEVCPSRMGLHRINLAILKAFDAISLADIASPVSTVPPGAPQADARLHSHALP
jgi:Rrf2 family protein